MKAVLGLYRLIQPRVEAQRAAKTHLPWTHLLCILTDNSLSDSGTTQIYLLSVSDFFFDFFIVDAFIYAKKVSAVPSQ